MWGLLPRHPMHPCALLCTPVHPSAPCTKGDVWMQVKYGGWFTCCHQWWRKRSSYGPQICVTLMCALWRALQAIWAVCHLGAWDLVSSCFTGYEAAKPFSFLWFKLCPELEIPDESWYKIITTWHISGKGKLVLLMSLPLVFLPCFANAHWPTG